MRKPWKEAHLYTTILMAAHTTIWIRIVPAWQKNGTTDLMNFLMTACSKATGISFPVQHALILPRSFCGRAKRNFGTPCPYSSSSSKSSDRRQSAGGGAGGSSPCRGLGQSAKALCRSIFHECCERPKDARNAAFSKFRGFSTVCGRGQMAAPVCDQSPRRMRSSASCVLSSVLNAVRRK